MSKRLVLVAVLIAGGAAPAAGASDNPAATPKIYSDLIRCRSITEQPQRLACFDAATAELEAAMQKRDIVIVDRQQIRQTRRTLFGLPVPDLGIFGRGGDEDEVDRVEARIASVGKDADGRWLLVLDDGARWQQIDGRAVAVEPKRGDQVVVRRATMGSFMMRIRGQPGIRVRRVS